MKLIFAAGPSHTTRVVVAIVLSLGLMVTDHRYHHMESLRAALTLATYPLHLIADLPASMSRGFSELFAERDELKTTNRALHEENLKLQARQQKFSALEAENMRLRDLLDSSFKVGDRVLIAELSSVDLDPYKQQVVINKGSNSGVTEGQPVLDAHAVMGQVTHVSPINSTVVLITDASHALPVEVLRNGLRTIAVGTGRINQLELPYLPNDSDIRENDLLVTSGLGGKFPPGYPVARVSRVQLTPDQPFAQVIAEPRAHLDRSREVLLVWTVAPVERTTLQTSGQNNDAPADGGASSTTDTPPGGSAADMTAADTSPEAMSVDGQ